MTVNQVVRGSSPRWGANLENNMAYGLETYDQYGSVVYSSADVTWNQVDYFTVPALPGTQFITYNYPVIKGKEVLVLQLLIDAPPTNRKAVAHRIVFNNDAYDNQSDTYNPEVYAGEVKVGGGSENALILVLMR